MAAQLIIGSDSDMPYFKTISLFSKVFFFILCMGITKTLLFYLFIIFIITKTILLITY